MVFIVVMCSDGNASCSQCYAADDAGNRRRWQTATGYRPGTNFARQDVFRGVIHHRVDVRCAVGLHAD